MVTRARAQAAPRLALAAEDERTAGEVARVAGERGVPVERLELAAAIGAPVGAIAYVPAGPIDAARAAALAPLCAAAAENRRPVILLAALERARGRAADERTAALAFLRTHGAVPLDEPDAWFEAAVLMAAYGPPPEMPTTAKPSIPSASASSATSSGQSSMARFGLNSESP